MSDPLVNDHSMPAGLRLHKLELYNWGTFDSSRGEVHTVRPNGQTALVIGRNGSGKSTLVDALLTLLVRPLVRNYNVAAGGHKRERDERSYIRGAYGRLSRDEDNRADTRFLRPGNSQYSALLACFRNERSGETFSVAQVLYITADGRAEKVYCFSPEERSLAQDCAGLTSFDKLRQQLERRGFRATPKYAEFHAWFVKATGVRAKGLDMFNQTVAVKDIPSLNDFIRGHMLEASPWSEKIDDLLNHFTQLSEAHQSLVRVRRQFELLTPIAERGAVYQSRRRQRDEAERLLDAVDSFFRQQTIAIFTPECRARREELTRLQSRRGQLDQDLIGVREEGRRLKNELDEAGGERLRQIPLLIDKHAAGAELKREANARFQESLRIAGLPGPVADAETWQAVSAQLDPLLVELDRGISEGDKERVELAVERRGVDERRKDDERELAALQSRRSNLPEAYAELRRRLCEDLRLSERDVPFAAELVAVKNQERDWESALEMALRGLALSLLVPQRNYAQVSAYIDRTRQADSRGRGQRLVYLRVGERVAVASGPVAHGQSLLRKLEYREGHPLLPWLKAELEERFDYRCCDTIEEFQEAANLALTRQRHLKVRGVRHEKDDRERTADPRQFVLGWDNREKCRRLAESVQERRADLARLDGRIDTFENLLEEFRARQSAARQLRQITDFAALDFLFHEREIESLRREQRMLEENSDVIVTLKQRLAEAQERERALQASRDEVVGQIRELERHILDGERLMATAQARLDERLADGSLMRHAESFAELAACFADPVLTAATLFQREQEFKDSRHAALSVLRKELEPLQNEICAAMSKFLRECPAEQDDLEARIEYLDGFLGRREQIERDDLPRHEQRFRERLNEKVTQEIGMLNGNLRSEASEIRSKIDLLNHSLKQLEYRPGTHMRLEPLPVHDREIAEFQVALKECLAGTFEGTPEADEARYVRIEKLIGRLREETRWRDKVTDVRRWFDFAAREIDAVTGAEHGFYKDSTGQSGGEKAKLAFTILVAAIAYQFDIDPRRPLENRFRFVVVDEMFSKVDDQYAEYALELFQKFGLQLLIVAPLDAKARVTERHVGCYLHVVKDERTNQSEIYSMTAREFEEVVSVANSESNGHAVSAAPLLASP